MNAPTRRILLACLVALGGYSACGQTVAGLNNGGTGANGQRPGGISYVTRRVPLMLPNQIAGGYFAAAGVPAGGAGGVGFPGGGAGAPGGFQGLGGQRLVRSEPATISPPTEVAETPFSPEARQALQRLARSGNVEARAVLAEYSAPAPTASSAPEGE